MGELTIGLRNLFTYCYRIFKHYASFIIGISTTYFVLGVVPQIYLYLYIPKDPTTGQQIISILAIMIQLCLSLGLTKIMLRLIDHREVHVSDLVNHGSTFLSYFVAYFIYAFAVLIGGFLLVLPGIYLAVRLQFYAFYIIDEGDTSFVALKKSWKATDRGFFQLLLFGACVLGLNFLGGLAFLIGMIVTYPITTMAMSVVYRGLQQGASEIPPAAYLPE